MGSLGMPSLPRNASASALLGSIGSTASSAAAAWAWCSAPCTSDLAPGGREDPEPEFVEDRSMAARFLREAQAAASLHTQRGRRARHGERRGWRGLLVLELLDGAPSPITSRTAALGMEETLSISCHHERARHGHEQGIVHRDIKPENILLSQDRAARSCRSSSTSASQDQRQPYLRHADRAVLGTPQYMFPSRRPAPATSARERRLAMACSSTSASREAALPSDT